MAVMQCQVPLPSPALPYPGQTADDVAGDVSGSARLEEGKLEGLQAARHAWGGRTVLNSASRSASLFVLIPEISPLFYLSYVQVADDISRGVPGAVPVPPAGEGSEAVVAALAANVDAMIAADRKVTALKQLQVRCMQACERAWEEAQGGE